MESYQTWIGEGPELSVLRMLGLFDRPADERVLGTLMKAPAIRGLTESLTNLSPSELRTVLARLRRARLLSGEDPHNPGHLDTHPLVREYFGEQLRSQRIEAWKECNSRLFNYYRAGGHGLTAEDRLFILMQAGLYLTATRGFAAPEALSCYERAESLCVSLNQPLVLFSALRGLWRYSLVTNKLSATMQIAKRVHSLAQDQKDSGLMVGAYRALAVTLFYLGDFGSARQYAMHGVQIWRSGSVQSPVEEITAPAVSCLFHESLCEWHFGEIASCHPAMAEAIALAKELNDKPALTVALW